MSAVVNFQRICPEGQQCGIGFDAIVPASAAVYIDGQWYDSRKIRRMSENIRTNLLTLGYGPDAIAQMQRRVPHTRALISDADLEAIKFRAVNGVNRRLIWELKLRDMQNVIRGMAPRSKLQITVHFSKIDPAMRNLEGVVKVIRNPSGTYVVSIFDGKKQRAKQEIAFVTTIMKWIDTVFRGSTTSFDFLCAPRINVKSPPRNRQCRQSAA